MSCLITPTIGATPAPEFKDCTIDLNAIKAGMLPIAGGKAANLGELIRAGFPVPDGFCVTTEAYRRIAESISIPFNELDSAPPETRAFLAAKTRDAFVSAIMHRGIARAITEAYRQLGDSVPVAVRSSATAEDLPHASFAGQQDTYLNVTGAAAVLEAVRRCWASLWTERAVAYRATQGIDHRAVRLAVVVQRMVDAKVAGVLFTANPVTGSRLQSVIDASPGLGEAVVSGSVNPDHFIVDTPTGDILECSIGDSHAKTAVHALQPCLSSEQVRALAATGRDVERHFGAPQDIEWAFDEAGALWLTQSRPITTLYPLPVRRAETPPGPRIYFCFSLAQGLQRPITPLGLATFQLLSSAVAKLIGIRVDDARSGAPVFAEAGQRMFLDVTGALRSKAGRTVLLRMFGFMEARSAATLHKVVAAPEFDYNRRSWLPFLAKALRAAVKTRAPLCAAHALICPDAARNNAHAIGEEIVARLDVPTGVAMRKRLEFIEEALGVALVAVMTSTMPVAAAGGIMLALASNLLGNDASSEEIQTVLRGLPHNITTEMDIELWQLSRSIREDAAAAVIFDQLTPAELRARFHEGSLPAVAQQGVAAFLSNYGHRGIAEIDLGVDRWSNDPSHVFGVLANYLRLENAEFAPDTLFVHGAAEASAMIETLVHRARFHGSLRGRLVKFSLTRTRQLLGLRELPKYFLVKMLGAVRRELLTIGDELTRRGKLDAPSDIIYLDFAGIRAAIDGRDLRRTVIERRHSYEAEMRRRHIPSVLLSDGTEPEACITSTVTSGSLTGTAASAGVVTARARVILDPVGARIEPGEILVTPSTDPGWTPLFLTAGGLIVETGGANSHGAVVAREYGIPAVVGVPDATARIKTGDLITVDGSAGIVAVTTSNSGR